MTKRPRRRKSASSDIVDGETKESRKNEKPFEEHELEKIEEEAPSRAPVIFETIRRMGDDELSRPAMALAVSGFLAGVAIGLSVFSEALLRTHLPDTPWRPLIENFGYTIGFLVVIAGRRRGATQAGSGWKPWWVTKMSHCSGWPRIFKSVAQSTTIIWMLMPASANCWVKTVASS